MEAEKKIIISLKEKLEKEKSGFLKGYNDNSRIPFMEWKLSLLEKGLWVIEKEKTFELEGGDMGSCQGGDASATLVVRYLANDEIAEWDFTGSYGAFHSQTSCDFGYCYYVGNIVEEAKKAGFSLPLGRYNEYNV